MTTYKTTTANAMIRMDSAFDESHGERCKSVDELREKSIQMYDKRITDDANLTVIVS